MRFVIEAVGLNGAGGRAVLLDLLRELREHEGHSFVLLLSDSVEMHSFESENVKCFQFPTHAGLAARHFTLHYTVPRICIREKADALLCMGNFAPAGLPCPTLLMVHNPYYAYSDKMAESRLTSRERLIVRYGRFILARLARHNRLRVVAQTETMKGRLVARYNFSPARATVIPNDLGCVPNLGDQPKERRVGSEFRFLTLTRYYAHKNLEILPEVMLRLAPHTPYPVRCVITISHAQHPGAQKLLARLTREGFDPFIENVGPVCAAELPALYASCHALLFPTLLESFSRTYLEAMQFGLPILTSDRDFAREICGDAALYFDPHNAEEIARCMRSVISDENLCADLAVKGAERLRNLRKTHSGVPSLLIAELERTAASPELRM